MLSSIISLLASAAEAAASWLRAKQQAKDQGDGMTAQRAADLQGVANVEKAELDAVAGDAAGPGTSALLHSGKA